MTIEPDTLIQALADGTRLRALVLLNRETSLCVCELTAALDVPQPKMSRHLAALRGLGIVEDARIANRVFYRLDLGLPDWARGALDRLADGLRKTGDLAVIDQRLRGFPTRPGERPAFRSADSVAEAGRSAVGDAVRSE